MLKIGLSSCFFHSDPQRPIFKGKTLLYMEQSITHWLMREGVMPFLIPAPEQNSKITITDLLSEFDGLVLQGGSDVSPKTYGEKPLRPEWTGDFIRDQYEIALIQETLKQKKPVLGVCRGAQILNVAFGGTLYQDIETQIPKAINHRDWNIYDQNFHEIAFEAGTRLEKLYAGTKVRKTNTIHHQAVKDLGKDLIIEAKSVPDGIIEAIRLKSTDSYAAAVQWHPEFHDSNDSSLLNSQPLLKDFLEEAKKAKKNRKT